MKREERITFQEATITHNDLNEEIKTWANIATAPTMWAEASPRTGREDFAGEQKHGFQRYQFKVLWRSDIDEQMRVSWNSKFWDIRSVTPVHKGNRHTELEIIAEWRQGQYQ